MEQKKIVIDSNGVMIEPDIHGKLVWRVHSGKQYVSIGLSSQDGSEKFKMYFKKIDNFVCSPMLLKNICTKIAFGNCPDSMEGWHALPIHSELLEHYREYYIGKEFNPVRYAHLGSSYGAEMLFTGDFQDCDITWEYVE